MATNHHTGVVEVPRQMWRLWTVEMRRGLWAEAWETHKDAFAADLLQLGHEPAVCHSAAVCEIQRRVDELTTGRDASKGPLPVGGFGHEWWQLRYDGCELGFGHYPVSKVSSVCRVCVESCKSRVSSQGSSVLRLLLDGWSPLPAPPALTPTNPPHVAGTIR